MRRAARKDASQSAIVAALRGAGASVWDIGRPVDLLVGFRGQTFAVEVKTPGTSYGRKLNQNQQDFADAWRGGPVLTVSTPEQALRAIGAIT